MRQDVFQNFMLQLLSLVISFDKLDFRNNCVFMAAKLHFMLNVSFFESDRFSPR